MLNSNQLQTVYMTLISLWTWRKNIYLKQFSLLSRRKIGVAKSFAAFWPAIFYPNSSHPPASIRPKIYKKTINNRLRIRNDVKRIKERRLKATIFSTENCFRLEKSEMAFIAHWLYIYKYYDQRGNLQLIFLWIFSFTQLLLRSTLKPRYQAESLIRTASSSF